MSQPAPVDILGFVEAIGEPLAGYDAGMSVVYVNPAARRLLTDENLKDLGERLRLRMISRTPAAFRYDCGDQQFSARAYPTENGGTTVLLREAPSTAHDERKMLEALMANVPIGITIADAPDVRVRWVSQQGAELTGVENPDIEALPYQAHGVGIYHADGVTPVSPEDLPLTRATRFGEAVQGEEWLLRKATGELIWLLCNACPIHDDDGAITGGILTFTDITDRKRADVALRRGAERLGLAQRAARCGTWDFDLKTRKIEWSDEFYEVFALDRSEAATPESWLEVVHPEDRDRLRQAFRTAIEERSDVRVEIRGLNGDTYRWFEMIGSTMTGEHGEAVRMLGIALDITDRKMIEERLNDAIERLETSNADLQKFAYVVSHDLQEPLRMIRSFAQLLGRTPGLDSKGAEHLGFIESGVDRMQSLILDLLEYSRVSYGPRLPLASTDFNYAARLAVEHLKSAIGEAGAEVVIEPLPAVMANYGRMLQVLQNLIGNAVKYRGSAPPKIRIWAERKGAEWIFGVSDNGIGIDPAYHDRIFGVFQRLHGREAYPGTGIGLAIVKRVIEQHQGRIWVESKAGEGATFFFSLPAGE